MAEIRRMGSLTPRLDRVDGTSKNLEKAREILGTVLVDSEKLADIEKELQEVERLLSNVG